MLQIFRDHRCGLFPQFAFFIPVGAVSNCEIVDFEGYFKLDELDGASGYAGACGAIAAGGCRSPSECPTLGIESEIKNSQTFNRGRNTGLKFSRASFNLAYNNSLTIELWFMQSPGTIGGVTVDEFTENQVIIGHTGATSDMAWWLGIENTHAVAIFIIGHQNWLSPVLLAPIE